MLQELRPDSSVVGCEKSCAEIVNREVDTLHGIIKDQGIVTRLRRGEHLAQMGQPTNRVYLIENGIVAYTRSNQTGKRQVMEFELSGSLVLPLDALGSGSPCSTEVLSNTEVYMMPTKSFQRYLDAVPMAKDKVALLRENLIARVFRSFANIGSRQGPQKIAWLLAYLWERQGCVCGVDGASIPVRQIDLADATGVTSVYVNQILRKLEKQGIISLHKGAAQVIDLPALKASSKSFG